MSIRTIDLARQVIRYHDRNHDGKLSRAEVNASDITGYFRIVDRHGSNDGRISAGELASSIRENFSHGPYVSKTELSRYLKAVARYRESPARNAQGNLINRLARTPGVPYTQPIAAGRFLEDVAKKIFG